jgi:DNA-binding transcriptional MerR regulator
MMKESVLFRDEFLEKTKISEQTLKEWEKLKLLQPVGFTDSQVPFYSQVTIERVAHIRQLLDLGYELKEIQIIIKQVGLPKTTENKNDHLKSSKYLTVGSLADRVGVSPRTIKHWENFGIIVPDMRSEGGFRLYSEIYVFLCKLIKDLQLFGYALDEIKEISDYFRDFLEMKANLELFGRDKAARKVDDMIRAIDALFLKMTQFKEGIARWEDLLKKKKKDILNLKAKNEKRPGTQKG